MLLRSPIVSFQEGIEVVSKRIQTYTSAAPYIATIRGMSRIGKSHFGREVLGKMWFSKKGTLTKPHDLEREYAQKEKLEYILLEIDETDHPYEELIERRTKALCGKIPDYRIAIVHKLEPLLDEGLNLQKALAFYNLIVENKEHPNYR